MSHPAVVFLGHAGWLSAWSLVLHEGAARCGAGPLGWLRRRPFGPLGLAGAGSLLGWCIYGSVLFGLAGLGLFRPGPIVGSALLCVAGSRAGWSRRVLWWEAARAGWALGWPWLAAFGAGLSPILVMAMTPGMDKDSIDYHIGTAWAWLQAGRCFAGDAPLILQLPLLADLRNVLPILLDDLRLCKCLVVGSMVCGAAFWADRCAGRGRAAAAWTGPLLAISAGFLLMLMNTSKNDVVACQLFVVGACLVLDGAWLAGSTFLGLALAAKLVYGPQAALLLMVFRPPRRLWLPVAILLALPCLPWWAKTWVATGNPLFPFGAGLFRTLDWSLANQQVFDNYQHGLWEEGTRRWQDVVPGTWYSAMKAQNLLLILAGPGLLLFRRTRALVLVCAAGEMLTLAAGHQLRYVIPSTVLLSCVIAEEAARWTGWRRTAGMTVLAGYSLARIAINPGLHQYPWADAWTPLDRARSTGTYGEAIAYLGQRPPARLLSFGDSRLCWLPGRVLFGGYVGETPLAWKIARASATPADVRRKFRQLGASRMLYNFVSIEWTEAPYVPFVWSDRDLHVYVEFCKRYLVPAWRTPTADYLNGGFYVFEILPKPLPHPPATTWFAPGTEAVYGPGTAHQMAHRLPEALQGYLDGWKRLPDVGFSWNLVGHGYSALGDMPHAFPYLEKFAKQGMMDSMNLAEYAAALVAIGRTAGTEKALDDAWTMYPNHRLVIRINQASFFGNQALGAILDGRLAEGARWLDKAEAMLAQIAPGQDPGNEKGRRATVAFMLGLRGEVALSRGDRARAAKCFRDSSQLDGSLKLSGRWRQLADELAPRMF